MAFAVARPQRCGDNDGDRALLIVNVIDQLLSIVAGTADFRHEAHGNTPVMSVHRFEQ